MCRTAPAPRRRQRLWISHRQSALAASSAVRNEPDGTAVAARGTGRRPVWAAPPRHAASTIAHRSSVTTRPMRNPLGVCRRPMPSSALDPTDACRAGPGALARRRFRYHRGDGDHGRPDPDDRQRQRREAMRRLRRGHRGHPVAGEHPRHRRAETRGQLGRAAGHQPRPVPVPRRPGLRAWLDGGARLSILPQGRGPRDHAARPDPGSGGCPGRRSAGACATASTATITSSSRPEESRLSSSAGLAQTRRRSRSFDAPSGRSYPLARPGGIWYPDLPRFSCRRVAGRFPPRPC